MRVSCVVVDINFVVESHNSVKTSVGNFILILIYLASRM